MAVLYTANLPQIAYSAQQVQSNEFFIAKKMGIEMYQLMQNAGESVFSLLWDRYSFANNILILTGKGNNGGDGYIVAKLAIENDIQVKVFSICQPDELKGDALKAYLEFSEVGGVIEQELDFSECNLIIDALLGTGLSGELSGNIKRICQQINQTGKQVISIDVPSGVNATTGGISKNAIYADSTVTFIGLKKGLLTGKVKDFVGELYFSGLGIDEEFAKTVQSPVSYLSEQSMLNKKIHREQSTYKNQQGHVLLIGGDKGMAGAIRLAGEACLRSGAGLVSIATHIDNVASVLQGRYELMVHGIEDETQLAALIEKASVIVIGPGMGQSDWSKMLFDTLFCHQDKIKVIDADALTFLAEKALALPNCVLTPHAGEAARLLQATNIEIESNRFDAVNKIANKYKTTSVLKGPGTLVCQGDRLNINTSGSPSMASAGMGDVLSGIIGALIAQKVKTLNSENSEDTKQAVFDMTCLSVFIHGKAAQLAEKDGINGLLASDLFPYIRRLVG